MDRDTLISKLYAQNIVSGLTRDGLARVVDAVLAECRVEEMRIEKDDALFVARERENLLVAARMDAGELRQRAETAEAALGKIASCESNHPQDVVAIARAALGKGDGR